MNMLIGFHVVADEKQDGAYPQHGDNVVLMSTRVGQQGKRTELEEAEKH
jgi:hypothetical protein